MGHDLRQYFYLEQNFINLNHGSFGALPKIVHQAQIDATIEAETHNDRWFRKTFYKRVETSRAAVAALIHADVKDIVLVENSSSACNAILRNMGLSRGDGVLVLSTAYNMVREILVWLETTAGIQ